MRTPLGGFRCAAALLAMRVVPALGVVRNLGQTIVDLGQAAGVRRAVDGVVLSLGEVDCDLRVDNLLDYTEEDVMGGSLNIVHSCIDSDGKLHYQGEGPCLYSLCVTAEWRAGILTYGVVVQHEASTMDHTVRIHVHMNEFQDLQQVPDLSFDSSSPLSPQGSTGEDVRCGLREGRCPAPTGCPSGTSEVEVSAADEAGDGWIDAFPGHANHWTVTDALTPGGLSPDGPSPPVANGTLPGFHYSRSTLLCLADGRYSFDSSAGAAWSSESSWIVCGREGKAGGSLEFQVGGGSCNVVDDSHADGPPQIDARTDSGALCSLPTESPCVGLDVGLPEPSGPAVGMYYDQACQQGGELNGCGGGGVTACRVCFINREFWRTDFPDKRYPDWVDCPCCVASALGVACQGGGVTGEQSKKSMLKEAEDYYWAGGTPLLSGFGGLLGLGLLTICCCCRDIYLTKRKAESYRFLKDRARRQNSSCDDTSTDVTPRRPGVAKVSTADFAAPAVAGGVGDPYAKVDIEAMRLPPRGSEGGREKRKTKTKPRKQQPATFGTNLKPPCRGDVGSCAAIAADAVEAPGLVNNRDTLSQSSGSMFSRWSGSRELKKYLAKTGYGKLDDDPQLEDQEQRTASRKEPRRGKKRSVCGGGGDGGGFEGRAANAAAPDGGSRGVSRESSAKSIRSLLLASSRDNSRRRVQPTDGDNSGDDEGHDYDGDKVHHFDPSFPKLTQLQQVEVVTRSKFAPVAEKEESRKPDGTKQTKQHRQHESGRRLGGGSGGGGGNRRRLNEGGGNGVREERGRGERGRQDRRREDRGRENQEKEYRGRPERGGAVRQDANADADADAKKRLSGGRGWRAQAAARRESGDRSRSRSREQATPWGESRPRRHGGGDVGGHARPEPRGSGDIVGRTRPESRGSGDVGGRARPEPRGSGEVGGKARSRSRGNSSPPDPALAAGNTKDYRRRRVAREERSSRGDGGAGAGAGGGGGSRERGRSQRQKLRGSRSPSRNIAGRMEGRRRGSGATARGDVAPTAPAAPSSPVAERFGTVKRKEEEDIVAKFLDRAGAGRRG